MNFSHSSGGNVACDEVWMYLNNWFESQKAENIGISIILDIETKQQFHAGKTITLLPIIDFQPILIAIIIFQRIWEYVHAYSED